MEVDVINKTRIETLEEKTEILIFMLHIGVRVQFLWGGGGGGEGGCSLLPEYVLHCLPKNQVVLLEYYLLFCPKIVIWKIIGDVSPPPPPKPRTPMILHVLQKRSWIVMTEEGMMCE